MATSGLDDDVFKTILAGETIEVEIELAELYDGLRPGRTLIVEGERGDLPGTVAVRATEVVTVATAEQPALPVGMELLGREFAEPTLLRLAYAYQQAVQGTALARQAPTTTPELPALVQGKGRGRTARG